MYNKILVTLDATPTDRAIIEHVKALAQVMHSRVVLLHVADGWAARMFGPDAVSPEIAEDKAYLEKVQRRVPVRGHSRRGRTGVRRTGPRKSSNGCKDKGCDLVAMSTHGHRFVADLFLGTTSRRVRHSVSVPVLLLKAK